MSAETGVIGNFKWGVRGLGAVDVTWLGILGKSASMLQL